MLQACKILEDRFQLPSAKGVRTINSNIYTAVLIRSSMRLQYLRHLEPKCFIFDSFLKATMTVAKTMTEIKYIFLSVLPQQPTNAYLSELSKATTIPMEANSKEYDRSRENQQMTFKTLWFKYCPASLSPAIFYCNLLWISSEAAFLTLTLIFKNIEKEKLLKLSARSYFCFFFFSSKILGLLKLARDILKLLIVEYIQFVSTVNDEKDDEKDQ